MSINSTMTALADEVRELSGKTGKLTLENMTDEVASGNETISDQSSLIAQIAQALEGKAAGVGEDVTAETNEYTDKLTTLETAITALEAELENKASGGGGVADPVIEPLEIRENGTYTAPDGVSGYSPVTVNVPIPDGYIQPDGVLEVTENGTHDVTEYASVNVSVPSKEPLLQEKTVTENGEVTPDDEYDGLSKVVVNVEASGGSDDMAGELASRTITEFSSNSCTAIGDYSFRGCESLQALVAPNAKSVGTYALYQCNKLKSIVLPSVTTVATNAFREASNLEVIDFHKLTAIPSNAFYGCRGLKALILRSETVVPLSSTNAFYQCYRILGTKNSGYNPNGEKIGFFYVPRALLSDDDETKDYRRATNWSDDTLVTQFRAIEDYPEITGG